MGGLLNLIKKLIPKFTAKFNWSFAMLSLLGVIVVSYQNCGNYSFQERKLASGGPGVTVTSLNYNADFITYSAPTAVVNSSAGIPISILFNNNGLLSWPQNGYNWTTVFADSASATQIIVENDTNQSQTRPEVPSTQNYTFYVRVRPVSVPTVACVSHQVRFSLTAAVAGGLFGELSDPLTITLCPEGVTPTPTVSATATASPVTCNSPPVCSSPAPGCVNTTVLDFNNCVISCTQSCGTPPTCSPIPNPSPNCLIGEPIVRDANNCIVSWTQVCPTPTPCTNNQTGSNGTCVDCPPGQISNANHTACVACGVDEIENPTGTCTACPAGSVANANHTACVACTGNQIENPAGTCTNCPAGQTANAAHTACTACGADQIPDANGVCTTCPAGQVANADKTACVACGVDEIENPAGTCTACPAGSVANANHTACTACGATQIENPVGTCTNCPAGQVPNANHTACVACGVDQIPNSTNGTCESCPAGTVANATHTACIACGADQIEDPAGTCTACPSGTVANANHTACVACGVDEIENPAGTCTACPSGTVANANHTACVACGVDQIENPAGTCTSCPAGQVSNANHTACVACGVDQIENPAGTCVSCPAGSRPNAGKTACEYPTGYTCTSWSECNASCGSSGTQSCLASTPSGWGSAVPVPTPAPVSCSGGACPTPTVTGSCGSAYLPQDRKEEICHVLGNEWSFGSNYGGNSCDENDTPGCTCNYAVWDRQSNAECGCQTPASGWNACKSMRSSLGNRSY